MTFTDDDLKHFHEEANAIEDDLARPWITASKLKSLLARLEKAEEVIKECLDHRGKSLIGSDDWHEAYEAWRKAKGE